MEYIYLIPIPYRPYLFIIPSTFILPLHYMGLSLIVIYSAFLSTGDGAFCEKVAWGATPAPFCDVHITPLWGYSRTPGTPGTRTTAAALGALCILHKAILLCIKYTSYTPDKWLSLGLCGV